jgi:hypothetical protein
MLHPTIDELTKGKYNRYELALATAKCARLITDEYVRQHDAAEKSITGNKETDRPLNTMIDRELRDEKAVRVAIGRLYNGEYSIDPQAGERAKAEAAAATAGETIEAEPAETEPTEGDVTDAE